MLHDIKQFSGEELKKIRGEILSWIKKNEKKKNSKEMKEIHTITAPTNYAKKKNMNSVRNNFGNKKAARGAIIAFAALAIITAGDIFGIYIFHIKNPLFISLNKIFPFPAVKIDSFSISYSSHMMAMDKIKKIAAINPKGYSWFQKSDSPQNNVRRFELLRFLQKKYSITLSDKDISKKADDVLNSSSDAMSNSIKISSITKNDIIEYLVMPEMIREKLMRKYQKNSESWVNGKKAAEIFIDNIEIKKMPYEEARQNIDQNFIVIENDLGFIERWVSKYNFDDSFFEATIGSLSKIYEDEEGFHVFMVVDRFTEINMVKIKDIVIVPEFNFEKAFLNDTKNVSIKNYID